MPAPIANSASQSDQSQSQSYFSSLVSYLPTTQSVSQRLNAWYETAKDTAHYYLADDPMVYSPENYFPEDIQNILAAKDEWQALEPQTNWLQHQFRIAFYKGLMQVTQNKIEPQEWLEKLASFKVLLPEDFVNQIFPKIEKTYNKYFKEIEQHATTVYQVPISVYRELFGVIENQFVAKQIEKQATQAESLVQAENSENTFKKVFNWICKHPTETAILGLTATAFYKSARLSEPENNFAPLDFISNFALAFGAQQIFNLHLRSTGLSNSILPTLFSFAAPAFAQITFLETLGGSNRDLGYAVTNMIDGGTMIAGFTDSFGAGGPDVLLSKWWANGTLAWAKTWGGTVNDVSTAMIVAPDGGIVVAGYTNSFGAGNNDVLLAKWWTNGTLVWAKTIGGTNYEEADALTITPDGGFAVAAQTYSFGQGAADLFLTKWWVNGTLAWAKTWGGTSDDYGLTVAVTLDGGILVGGSTRSFGAGDHDVLFSKWWMDGTLVWAKTLGGGNYDAIFDINVMSDGSGVAIGTTQSFGAGSYDMLLAKWWSNGTLAWAKTLGGALEDDGRTLALTPDSGIVVSGYTYSFGTGTPTYPNVLLAKWWSNGTLAWARVLGGVNGDTSYSIVVTPDGGIMVTGTTYSFGDTVNGDMLLAKLTSDGQIANCTYLNAITSSVTDISGSVSITSPSVTPQNWGVAAQDWSTVTTSTINPTLQQQCFYQPLTPNPTPGPTPNPTPFPTPPGSTPPSTQETTQSSGPTKSSSSTSNAIPLAVGLVVGGVVTLGGIGGTVWFFKKRKKQNKKAPSTSLEMAEPKSHSEPDSPKPIYDNTQAVMNHANEYINVPKNSYENVNSVQQSSVNRLSQQYQTSLPQSNRTSAFFNSQTSNSRPVSHYENPNLVQKQENKYDNLPSKDVKPTGTQKYENVSTVMPSNLNPTEQYENVSATQKPAVRNSNLPNNQYENVSEAQKNKPKPTYENVPKEDQDQEQSNYNVFQNN